MEILKDHRDKWGYTLLELIVVLALFSIILSIALPSLNIVSDMRERDELKRFRRDILFARNMAVVENSSYILTLDYENNKYIIKRKQDIDKTIKIVEFKYGIRIKESQMNWSITFKPTGSPNTGTTIYLANRKKEDIDISITPATCSINVKKKK